MSYIGIIVVIIGVIASIILGVALSADLGKIATWMAGPKEWFGSLLLRGSFRPRVHTVLILLLTLLVTSALSLVVLVTTDSEWLGYASMGAALFIPLGTKKLWTHLRKREHIAVQIKRDKRAHQLKSSLASRPSGNYLTPS